MRKPLKEIPICETCAQRIFLQQAKCYVEVINNIKKMKR